MDKEQAVTKAETTFNAAADYFKVSTQGYSRIQCAFISDGIASTACQ
jgi:hypothetical protein